MRIRSVVVASSLVVVWCATTYTSADLGDVTDRFSRDLQLVRQINPKSKHYWTKLYRSTKGRQPKKIVSKVFVETLRKVGRAAAAISRHMKSEIVDEWRALQFELLDQRDPGGKVRWRIGQALKSLEMCRDELANDVTPDVDRCASEVVARLTDALIGMQGQKSIKIWT